MSEGGEATAASTDGDYEARFSAFAITFFFRMLGNRNHKFSDICLRMLLHKSADWSDDKFRQEFDDEQDICTFYACVRVACKLAGYSALKPEELLGDVGIWDRLISEVGADASDVHTIQAYVHPTPLLLGEDQVRNEEERELAHLSFTDYQFEGEAHIHLYDQLQEKREEAHIATHYSPCVALVQASGVGKSRAVMQMSNLGVYICYCSLAGKYSSASPPRTGKLADKLATTFHEDEMVLYLKAWLKVLDESISNGNITSDAWKEQQLPSKDGSPKGDVAERVCAEWEMLLAQKDFNYENNISRDRVNISACSTEVKAIKCRFKDSDSCRVLFVFDEARGLQIQDPKTNSMSKSPFYQITRALRVFFHEKVFFAIFLDTAARVSNLLPNEALQMGVRLLPPIYCLPNMALHRSVPGLSAQTYWDPETWLMYGRPLWAARWSKSSSIETLLAFAEQKLLCTLDGDFDGVKVDVWNGIMTQSQAIALLSAAAGLSICARSMLAERLAASHMNLILRVTDNTEERRIYVGLSAEPILAEAAGSILGAAKVQEEALRHLDKACLAGYVTPGPRGEFVTKFILVAAVWHSKKDWILRPIPVDQFLGTLLCAPKRTDEVLLNRVKQKCPKDGVVFFNSFVIIRRPPETADLGKAAAAGHALMYKAENCWPGADMIIPVWTPDGMTAIVISAKNVQNAHWLEKESVEKVKSEYTHVMVAEGLPSITILMSLREPQMKDNDNWVLWDSGDPTYIHLTCYGIDRNYSFLGGTVKAFLKKLLVTVPDELSDATDTERQWIESMVPEQFERPDSTYSHIPYTEEATSRKRRRVHP